MKSPKPKTKTILFASDVHGNISQYKIIFEWVIQNNFNYLIFGGDMLPKSFKKRTVDGQYKHFKKKMLPVFKNFQKRAAECNINTEVIFVFGNDDFRALLKHVRDDLESVKFCVLSNDRFRLDDELDIIGYSFVPPTPFKYKDWEKLESRSSTFHSRPLRLEGNILSRVDGFIEVDVTHILRQGNIFDDLARLFSTSTRPTILVSHAPPANSTLDQISGGAHVGSTAVRDAILRYSPMLSLHGHIHETVDVSGSFEDLIASTHSYTTGNYYNAKCPFVVEIVINSTNVRSARRIHLDLKLS